MRLQSNFHLLFGFGLNLNLSVASNEHPGYSILVFDGCSLRVAVSFLNEPLIKLTRPQKVIVGKCGNCSSF